MLMASGSFFHMATLPVTHRLWRMELVFAEGGLQVGLVVQERDCDLGLVRVFRHLPVALVLEQCPAPRLIQRHKMNQQAWNQHSGVMSLEYAWECSWWYHFMFLFLHFLYLLRLTSSHWFSHYITLRPQCELILLYKEVGHLQRRRRRNSPIFLYMTVFSTSLPSPG